MGFCQASCIRGDEPTYAALTLRTRVDFAYMSCCGRKGREIEIESPPSYMV